MVLSYIPAGTVSQHRFVRLIFLLVLLGTMPLQASTQLKPSAISESIGLTGQSHRDSARVQMGINAVSEKTQEVVAELMQNQRQADITEAYNAQLSRLIASQEQEILGLGAQIESIEETERACCLF